jgi:hypothetical protein
MHENSSTKRVSDQPGWATAEEHYAELYNTMSEELRRDMAAIDIQAIAREGALRRSKNCDISERFAYGGYHIVFELVFEDGVVWISKVYRDSRRKEANVSHKYVKTHMESSICTMNYVRKHTNLPVPKVHAWDTSEPNSVGGTWMMMDVALGCNRAAIPDTDDRIVNDVFMAHHADTLLQLSALQFSEIGLLQESEDGGVHVGPFVDFDGTEYGPFSTSTQYYQHMVNILWKHRTLTKFKDHDVMVRQLFPLYLYQLSVSLLDFRDVGPFPLFHTDLTINILLNEEGHMAGIIDWDWSGPVPSLAQCMRPEGIVPQWRLDGMYRPDILKSIEDQRHRFEQMLDEKQAKLSKASSLPNLVATMNTPEVELAEAIVHYSEPRFKDSGEWVFRILF